MMVEHAFNSCSGTKYDGANFICQRCLKPCFMECFAELPEMKALIAIANVKGPATKPNSTPSYVAPQANIVQRISRIFSQQSFFGFTCTSCIKNGSYSDILRTKYKWS